MQQKSTYTYSKTQKAMPIDEFLLEQQKNRVECKGTYNERVDEITACLSALVKRLEEE
jgi:hypothetical protein